MPLLRYTSALLFGSTALALAQGGRRPLTPADWDRWRSIVGTTLSADGEWVAYSLVPQVGEGELVVRATHAPTEWRVARGFIGRPQVVAGFQESDSTARAAAPAFTRDGRWVVTPVSPTRADYEAARRQQRRMQPKVPDGIAILSTAEGRVTVIPRVRSVRVPRDGASVIAYLLEGDDSSAVGRRDSTPPEPGERAATPGGALRPVGDSLVRARRRAFGTTLVLRDLATGGETRIADVTAFALDDSARWLGYTVASPTPGRDGAYARRLSAPAVEHALATGPGEYRALVLDRAGTQAAFYSTRAESGRPHPRPELYHADLRDATPRARRAVAAAELGDGMVFVDSRLAFTRAGNAVLLAYTAAPLDSIPADSLVERAVLDLWHYRDPRLQPQQRVEATRPRPRSYGALWHVAPRRLVRITSDSLPSVQVSDDGRTAMLSTDLPYAVESMWGEGGSDVLAVDALTGARTLVATRVRFPPQLSPAGRFITWFDSGHWYAYEIARRQRRDLTGVLPGVRFDQETWDTPESPAPWGLGGWTPGDRSVLVYDRYDIWEIDPTGVRPARVVTDSLGRRQHLVLRVVDLDPDDPFVDPAAPTLLRAVDDETKASGFYEVRLAGATPPQRVVMAEAAFGTPIRARHAAQFVVTRGTFVHFPDLYTGPTLASLARLSDANPQQAEFRWGSVELVHWTSGDGHPLRGLLYKPADFDPARRYPMITYFYEQLSQNLHTYVPPGGRNVVNPAHYTSNGYLVFEPDIRYETGYPGPSAVRSVVPGVQSLLARGFVDPAGLGIQGQSWGGYQTLFIITQTPLFRAAMAGAPVVDMFSAYGGIRWQSGLARPFQYEHSQSRIGGSIWQFPLRYIENSPLFWLERVRTPLLVMANDGDGAVPWYQGIETFVAMRRLGKEVYLLNYNGDEHNPTKRANQVDVALRMQQFFDHHLRGAPAPDWMQHGIPFRQKGRAPQPVALPRATAGAAGETAGAARP